jgi:hypothetical protein
MYLYPYSLHYYVYHIALVEQPVAKRTTHASSILALS